MATPAAKLEKLRALLLEHNLQAYVVPSDDAHQVFSTHLLPKISHPLFLYHSRVSMSRLSSTGENIFLDSVALQVSVCDPSWSVLGKNVCC
jgi:hypothetical protein